MLQVGLEQFSVPAEGRRLLNQGPSILRLMTQPTLETSSSHFITTSQLSTLTDTGRCCTCSGFGHICEILSIGNPNILEERLAYLPKLLPWKETSVFLYDKQIRLLPKRRTLSLYSKAFLYTSINGITIRIKIFNASIHDTWRNCFKTHNHLPTISTSQFDPGMALAQFSYRYMTSLDIH